ncbi:type II toxin-antitoxin system RelB family antitoxin [Lactococcus insecticola]|uniref:CopG family transcriptional regulator n=1 Tax=Pseudolactococcus insecticola TaxID=2709158 RepID=A0A6A0BAA5_9LACT|nr:DUF6290 family protein [Lactococcus insecticola]GFH41304.1 hypothetical protein Hs20B_17020 [Lactococcus insecticola]
MTIHATSGRFDSELMNNINEYAKAQHMAASKFIEQAVSEKLEDLLDYQISEEAYRNWEKNNFKTYKHEEMWSMLGIDEND